MTSKPAVFLPLLVLIAAALVGVTRPVHAQQNNGLAVPPLPSGPVTYQAAEGVAFRVVPLASGLNRPWSMAFLPDGGMLITLRGGGMHLFRNGEVSAPIAGVPEVRDGRLGGLFDVKLHPDYASNGYVYLTYNFELPDGEPELRVMRGIFNGTALVNTEDIFIADGGTGVSRLLFLPDGKFLVTVYGESGEGSQDPSILHGKILRLNDDGSVPGDNPFIGRDGFRPEIYTMGHRSPAGLVYHAPSGQVWEGEMGPNGGDEVNVLEPGGNYGWPYVSLGRSYGGPWQPDKFHREGMTDPVVYWMPSISTTGIAFYSGDRFPQWNGNLFVGGLRYGEIQGTGQLARIVFNDDMEEIRRENLLADLRQRIRDVRQGPDGLLYLLTDTSDGALLRIEPFD